MKFNLGLWWHALFIIRCSTFSESLDLQSNRLTEMQIREHDENSDTMSCCVGVCVFVCVCVWTAPSFATPEEYGSRIGPNRIDEK